MKRLKGHRVQGSGFRSMSDEAWTPNIQVKDFPHWALNVCFAFLNPETFRT